MHALGIELLRLGELEQILEHAPAAQRPRLRARELEAVAAVVDADAELALDLAQVLVELAAQAREPARIVRRERRRFSECSDFAASGNGLLRIAANEAAPQ